MSKKKRTLAVLLSVMLLCMMLVTAASAAGEKGVWLEEASEDGTTALVVTDTAVTDGVVKLTYDGDALSYEGIELNESYVAMYSVNAEQEGTVLISWVAPEAYETDGDDIWLIQVNFSGTEEAYSVTLSGSASDAEGNAVPVEGAIDTVITPDSDPSDATTETDGGKTPGTGDGMMLGTSVIIALAALCAVVVMLVMRNRKGGAAE